MSSIVLIIVIILATAVVTTLILIKAEANIIGKVIKLVDSEAKRLETAKDVCPLY